MKRQLQHTKCFSYVDNMNKNVIYNNYKSENMLESDVGHMSFEIGLEI